jgi:hypothetical protein
MSGHSLTFQDAARIRAAARAAEVSVAFLNAVRHALTAEVVALHDACGTATFARGGNVDGEDFIEEFDVKVLTDFDAVDGRAEFANEAFRFAFRLLSRRDLRGGGGFLSFAVNIGDVSALTPFREASRLVFEPELNRFIPVLFKRFHLKDAAWTRLNNGNRDHFALFGVQLGHTEFLSK